MICCQFIHLWSESDSPAARTEDLSDWLCLSEDRPLEHISYLLQPYAYQVMARYEINVSPYGLHFYSKL
jgi:hypothetical protein